MTPSDEEVKEIYEQAYEIDDPWERALYVNEELVGAQRTALTEMLVHAVAYDLAESFK